MVEISSVLCCGNICFDIPVYSAEDIGWNQTRWVETISESIGGNGANTSYVLGKMGVPVRLISRVGQDSRGERLIHILQEAGVDVSSIGRMPGVSTPTTCVLVQKGGARKFYHRPGASRELDAADLSFGAGGHSHFHLANPFSMPNLRPQCGDVMCRAKQAGMTTSIDTGWDSLGRWIEDLGPALPYTDLFFVNDSEAEMLGGVDNLRALGARNVVVKTGPDGCVVNGEHVPGFRVEAVDTTGAGDCFAGAFLAALTRGREPLDCARFANAVGALNVQQLGAIAGVRDYEETLEWMKSA